MIYERIKKLREKQGYTQTELAKMLGVTRSCVNAWEMGISVPSTQSLVQLAQIFDMSTDYLLGLDVAFAIRTDGLLSGLKPEDAVLWPLLIIFNIPHRPPHRPAARSALSFPRKYATMLLFPAGNRSILYRKG